MQILINDQLFALGQPLPSDIYSCDIQANVFECLLVQLTSEQEFILKQWFNQLINNCSCEWIIFNNTYYRVDELTQFE